MNCKERKLDKSNFAISALRSEKGIALMMILVLSAIALGVIAGLIYMIISGTQVSGTQKRYRTALEAGLGGTDMTYQFIAARGDPSRNASLLTDLTSLNPAITTSNSCTGTNLAGISFTGLAAKLNAPTTSWSSACDNTDSMAIIPTTPTSYDLRFDLGGSPYPTYRAYAKIVDTVEGNSGADEGLLGRGVVNAGSGEIRVVSKPYLYTVEVDAENPSNPTERSKLSILYQY